MLDSMGDPLVGGKGAIFTRASRVEEWTCQVYDGPKWDDVVDIVP